MERKMEPEVMDEPARAEAYAAADFSEVNQRFVNEVLLRCPAPALVLDLGCGPADIPIRLAHAAPAARITAVDASPAMMALARQAVGETGLDDRVTLVEARLPGLPLAPRSFDLAMSNSLVHHLPEPVAFWQEIARLAAPGAYIHVMDLIRPETPQRAAEIVEAAAAKEHPLLKEDFYNSLLAAFTIDEVAEQVAAAGLGTLWPVQSSDRHWLVSGRI
ncbi:MAG: class I SAM-dependent methyltransferase [Elusimicrobia bacterium]|nr:class I SAM-dependent methyltransferase [Elusimicrobiota bacterium]